MTRARDKRLTMPLGFDGFMVNQCAVLWCGRDLCFETAHSHLPCFALCRKTTPNKQQAAKPCKMAMNWVQVTQKKQQQVYVSTIYEFLIQSLQIVCNMQNGMECCHMTSRRPYWCPKTMKRRAFCCPKSILWELNSFLMQTLSFASLNLHRCWPREWKHSTETHDNLCNICGVCSCVRLALKSHVSHRCGDGIKF